MLINLVPTFKVLVPLGRTVAALPADQLKAAVIRELVRAAGLVDEVRAGDVIASLIAREAKGSTGLGRAIAIPHARTECIEKPVIVLGICPEGLDWEAQDGKDVVLFFLILVPLEQSDLYLRILTRLTALVRIPAFVESIVACPDEAAVLEKIHEFELQLKLRSGGAEPGADPSSKAL